MNDYNQQTRREFFNWGMNGLGATALATLLSRESTLAASKDSKLQPKARRAIHICLVGGMSHVDSFDYKSELKKFHGKSLQTDEQPDLFFGKMGLLRQQDWEFKPRGQSGLMISDMFPRIAERFCDRWNRSRPITHLHYFWPTADLNSMASPRWAAGFPTVWGSKMNRCPPTLC